MSAIAAALLALSAPAPATVTLAIERGPAVSLSQHMAPLAPLVGEWRGSGWMLMPDGTRRSFESRETVTSRLSGNALLVEGRHYAPGNPQRPVHDAMAMITWDQRAGAYRFRSALANGSGGDFPLEVSPGRFAWRMEMQGARIDYVAEFTGDTWTERGRRTGADGRSIDFFEMRLRRQ
jgi:hypothetical protein